MQRIGSIDTLKWFAILLVVVGGTVKILAHFPTA